MPQTRAQKQYTKESDCFHGYDWINLQISEIENDSWKIVRSIQV